MEGIAGDGSDKAMRNINGYILDVDYLYKGEETSIRLCTKDYDGSTYEILDPAFKPYFYFKPYTSMEEQELKSIGEAAAIPIEGVEKLQKSLFGKPLQIFKIILKDPQQVPKLRDRLKNYGDCYEYDIPFAKRYVIDKSIKPLNPYSISFLLDEGFYILEKMEEIKEEKMPALNTMCFDIETYNPKGASNPAKDPVLMISYAYRSRGKSGSGIITYKKIARDFVETVADEKEMFKSFVKKVEDLDIDIIAGYNSANFDIKYLIDRAASLHIKFNLSRFKGETRIERHGLVDKVKIAGRVHVDVYLVSKFIAVVGSSANILKLNDYTLRSVYEAVSGDKKVMVEKKAIFKMWDGSDSELEALADYNLNDSYALSRVYDEFMPIMFEMTRLTGNLLSDVCVSTTGQLVEFLMMAYAYQYNEIVPNKPTEAEVRHRLLEPIEGAYVKTPEPGIYSNLAILDFHGLYPSIIVSHNIDPSAICSDCKDYYEAPTGTRFDKSKKAIIPTILSILIQQRAEVKKAFKLDPDNIILGARSQALKILANSFYGYLGYARSRYYSRECAAATTAYGREYIKSTIKTAEDNGFKVIYSDTDSIVVVLESKSKEDVLKLMKDINSKLPSAMELELEDFYTRGLFVGKKTDKMNVGAKKKYALLSESGRIKIKGFELVRRDWSKIARTTQKAVLESILKTGDAEAAADIVRDTIERIKSGNVPLADLSITAQIRKNIDSYDILSPEVSAAKKEIAAGIMDMADAEGRIINYVIAKEGSSISDKATPLELAKDYDPNYYINNQVLPAVLRILKELNYDKEMLLNKGSQKKL
ncbi:MAG: DNA-directed DNA polymerase [Candidatus Micrarchaeia archaeon]